MNQKRIKITLVLGIVLLPLLTGWVYQTLTAFPEEITLATGPPGGQFSPLMQNLAEEIENQLAVKVNLVSSDGSLENILLLKAGEVDFGLYQTWTVEIIREFEPDFLREIGFKPQEPGNARIEFVANVYSQAAHFVVHRDTGIRSPADLAGKNISLGLKRGGDYAMSLLLLNHLGVEKSAINAKHVTHNDVREGFINGTIETAFMTLGLQAPIFTELFETGCCEILSIPYAKALAAKHSPIYEYEIPAGRYQSKPPPAPASTRGGYFHRGLRDSAVDS